MTTRTHSAGCARTLELPIEHGAASVEEVEQLRAQMHEANASAEHRSRERRCRGGIEAGSARNIANRMDALTREVGGGWVR